MFAEVSAERVIGGAERVLRHQALGLRARGHEVILITRASREEDSEQADIEGVAEHRYQVDRRTELSFVASTLQRSVAAFDRATEAAPIDVAIIHQALAGLGTMLQRPRQVQAWTYMCLSLAHEEFMTRVATGAGTGARLRWTTNARVRQGIERFVIRRCRSVVVLSEFMRRRIMEVHGIPAQRISLIPGAVDPQQFMPPLSRADVRRALELTGEQTVLFTVRNLVPRMGIEHLIDAVVGLRERHPTLLVLIGGEGPLRGALEARIARYGFERQVRLLGFVPEALLQQYYQAADLVVMPTLQLEGFGLVTVEAMACGTPVLSTPVAALPEVVGRLDPLLVAEGTDGTALAKAIDRILTRFRSDPAEHSRLSLKGRRLVEQVYNWDRHCGELDQAFSHLVRKKMGQAA
ncbi:MAG: hypothetical protein OJF47_000425 [Nitrospira sp.]|jgi:glycosyltransferase involved in cell wall biosynthesis|nr:MAG: hypothetical protein OJF47_000425 [Nitrospira sp.]